MNASIRTVLYAVTAAVLVVVALATAPRFGPSERLEDEGQLFFPDFTDPGQATSLEIQAGDESSGTVTVFKVERKDGVWTIPSHYGYPADAKEKMAAAASMFIGLRKGAVRSESRADHAELGVVDPMEPEGTPEGRGTLVTFRAEDGRPLGRLVIGEEVEGREGQRYVREPDKRRTYTAKIETLPSTRFADWVETDLLRLSSWDVRKLVFDNYSVDEAAGQVRQGDTIVATKADGSWSVAETPEGREANADALDAAAQALDEMKIVGVRPKPEGLTERLETARGFDFQVLAQSLAGRGFFVGEDRLYSNDGDLLVTTKDGVRYTLAFGEIAADSPGEEAADDGGEGDGGEDDEGAEKESRPNRYLMVTVGFDGTVLEPPEGVAIDAAEESKVREAIREIEDIVVRIDGEKGEAGQLPDDLAGVVADDESLSTDPWDRPYEYETTEDGYRVISRGLDGEPGGEGADADVLSDELDAARERLDQADAVREYEGKVKKGKERVEELTERFAPWYYVIDADLFDELKLDRDDVTKVVEEDEGGDGGGVEITPPDGDGEASGEATPGGEGGEESGAESTPGGGDEEKPADTPPGGGGEEKPADTPPGGGGEEKPAETPPGGGDQPGGGD